MKVSVLIVSTSFARGEPKDGSRSELDRNTNDLTYETGKENGILAEFGFVDGKMEKFSKFVLEN